MIPSDHFVRYYNEIFKVLRAKGPEHLDRYYECVAKRQAFFTLQAFKDSGLKGMYDYWSRITIEENCDMDLELKDGCLKTTMNVCPSLSKNLDNDAGVCEVYCDHCPGWVCRVIGEAGYYEVYDLVDRLKPTCIAYIYEEKAPAEKKYAELLAMRGADLVRNNFRFVKERK